MENRYDLRFYEPGDEIGAVSLFKLSFPDWKIRKNSIKYWNWKYLENPYGSKIAVAVAENKIIGICTNLFLNVKILDNIYKTTYSDDAATHPDFRGKKVYTNVENLIQSDPDLKRNDFYYTITYNPYILKDQQQRGFQEFPKPLAHMLYINDLSKHLDHIEINNKTITKIGYLIIKTLNNLLNKRKTTVNPDFIITDTTKFDQSIDIFWNQIRTHYNFILEKNGTYLNWRYCSKYTGNYKIKQAVQGNNILGFIVMEILDTGEYKTGNIIELLTLPEYPDVMDALISEAMKYYVSENINVIYYMTVKGHPSEKALNRFGFIERLTHNKLHILCDFNKIKKSYELIQNSDPAKLCFSIGDYL